MAEDFSRFVLAGGAIKVFDPKMVAAQLQQSNVNTSEWFGLCNTFNFNSHTGRCHEVQLRRLHGVPCAIIFRPFRAFLLTSSFMENHFPEARELYYFRNRQYYQTYFKYIPVYCYCYYSHISLYPLPTAIP